MNTVVKMYEETIKELSFEMYDNGCKVRDNKQYSNMDIHKKAVNILQDWLWLNLRYVCGSIETYKTSDDVDLHITIINGLIVAYQEDIYD